MNELKPAVLKFQARMKNRPPGDNSASSCDCGESGCYTVDDTIRGIQDIIIRQLWERTNKRNYERHHNN